MFDMFGAAPCDVLLMGGIMNPPLKAASAFPADDLPGKWVAVLVFIPLRHTLFFPALPDDRSNRLKGLPAHNRWVVAFHVVHILFAPVCMPVKLAVRIGLLEQDVPGIFLIFQNPTDCGGSPPSILFSWERLFHSAPRQSCSILCPPVSPRTSNAQPPPVPR